MQISANMKLGRFKWNRSGYAEVMNEAPCQNYLKQYADKVLARVNATFTSKYKGDEYVIKKRTGKLANGYIVKANSRHARRHNAKYKTLRKAL